MYPMSFTMQEWSSKFDVVRKRVQHIKGERTTISHEEAQKILKMFHVLESQLKAMESAPFEYEVTKSDVARKQVLLANTKHLFEHGSFKNITISELTASGKPDAPSSASAMKQLQIEKIQVQDSMLSDLSKGMDTLQGQSTRIGEEVKGQSQLLGQLEHDTDNATQRLLTEANRTTKIREQTRMCWLYMVAAAEFLVLVLLILLSLR